MTYLLAFLVIFLYLSGLGIFRAMMKTSNCTDKHSFAVHAFWFVWFWVALYEIIRDHDSFEW